MTDEQPSLRRRYTDPNTDEVFDVTYREGRMIISDGLRQVEVFGERDRMGRVYRLDLEKNSPHYYPYERFNEPVEAIAAACDFLYKIRGSDYDPSVPLERFVRELPEASA